MRHFNTAGPCKPEIHYMLPAAARLPEVRRIIDQLGYFVIHAPRQTGKTTTMMALAHELTAGGKFAAIVVSMQVASVFSHDIEAAERVLLSNWRDMAEDYLPPDLRPPAWPAAETGQRIQSALRAWARAIPRPLVVFIDEIDALQDEALLSALHQLRDGYPQRPKNFPASLALVGLRDVRDYKVASGGSERLGTASPFNIKVRSLTLGNFTAPEVAALYRQHTADTGQVFTGEAVARAFELTQGQPYLVNALAKVAVEELVTETAQAVEIAQIEQAKEILIQRQETHLDSLAERLREPRVRAIIEPILAGKELGDLPFDDLRFVTELGLVRTDGGGSLQISNAIYREVIPRVLAAAASASLPPYQPVWLRPDGSLDPDKLLEAFLAFWRQHGQPLLQSVHYHEIAPHIVLMAFLHRVVNGGGTLEREYAVGSRRMDLCLRYGPKQSEVTLGIELKVWRDGERDPLDEGLTQLDAYLSSLGLESGWLVIFDQRRDLPPISERTTAEQAVSLGGRAITVIRG